MNLTVGETTKAKVIEFFGPPNITTRDGSGQEMRTYQRAAKVTQSSGQAGYWSVLLLGASTRASGFESSSRMLTLIIKFNEDDIVIDLRSRASEF